MASPARDVDLPEDFFNDLADENFIDGVLDNGGPESDEDLLNYVAEINKLQTDIERRKQRIKETEASLSNNRHTRSRSRSPSSSSKSRRHREREKERESKRRRTRSRSRSRSPYAGRHSRHDERIREKRYPLSPLRGRAARRSRSKSPRHRTKRSTSTHKNISFLEELAQKFAEKGQAFPEKDALLMGQHQMNSGMDQPIVQPSMDFGNPMTFEAKPLINIPNYPQSMPLGFPTQPNLFYGMNPMSVLAGNAVPQPTNNLPPFPVVGVPREMPPRMPIMRTHSQILPPPIESTVANNQKALIDRCEQAIKLIRAKDNRVPVMKFLCNRTSMVVSNSNELVADSNRSPLAHSRLNVSFKLNAPSKSSIKNDGLKMLPKRVRDIAQSLGINSGFLFDRMRTKEINAQITDQLKNEMEMCDSNQSEILIQTSTVSEEAPLFEPVEMADMGTQTAEFKCGDCSERNKRIMVSAHTQTFTRTCSIGIQTNEKDYREPIVELLSRMTAAQLVAIKDFANIIDEPRPRDREEMFKTRERLMDIYSLSQRDADTVRATEDSQMDDGQFIDQLRFRGGDMYEGTSREYDRQIESPRFNGSSTNDRNNMNRNFNRADFSNDRNMIDDMSRRTTDDRFQRMDGPYSRNARQDEEEERERQRYIEMERQRELEMERSQRAYDERMERERMRADQELGEFNRLKAMQTGPQQRPLQGMSYDEFSREMEDRDTRPNSFNSNRGGGGALNRRGRGAFRENFRGGRGNRR